MKMTTEWQWIKCEDFMIFNPTEKLPKGTIGKKVSMDKITPHTKEITSFDIEEFKGGTKFKNGDTLMARITPCLENGKISQVNFLDEQEIGFGSTEFIVLREKEGVSDKEFIYYLSQYYLFKNTAISSMIGSSGRQRVQNDVNKSLELQLPPLKTQKKIGKILSQLDEKIKLNIKINNKFSLFNHIIKEYFCRGLYVF